MTDSAEKMRKADRTRIFFDTEFIEDGKTIDLISIGMVRDDGETYYAESSDCDLSRADQWVKDNVLIHLRGGSAIKSRRQIAADIVAFAGPSPEFWAYYADYDWVVLCQLFGRMIDLPKGWPMFCRDLKQLAGDTVLPQQISTEHHALADAVWVSETFAALSAKSDGGGESRPAETGTGGLAPCIKQTTPATMPAQAGVAPGPSDPIPSQPDEREAIARIINPKAFDESYWARGRQSDVEECPRCKGSGEIAIDARTCRYVAPGPVPDDAKGVVSSTCFTCAGMGYIECEDDND